MSLRVVITGIGVITPAGNDTRTLFSAVTNGMTGIGPITRFDASRYPSRIAGEVRNFDARVFLSAREVQRTDLFVQYGTAAALLALEDARFTVPLHRSERTGVLVGSGRGGVSTTEKNLSLLLSRGVRAVSPFFTPMSLVNMASAFIAIKCGARGPCLDVSTACATGTHAIGEAMKIIQRGDADVMLAGGAEAALTPLILAGFCQAKALSVRNDQPGKASRPFDNDRDGFVLSEGAGVVVLEELEHARKRSAGIYAELLGYGLSSDAFHYTMPEQSGEGSSRAMGLALRDAGIAPADVGYINAHGTATRSNDRIETVAIKKTFGDHAKRLAISSSKSVLGHMLGAAGAVETAITALALRDGVVPPTSNLETPDPDCDLDYTPRQAVRREVRIALSNSLGFGGVNAAIVIKKY